MQTAPDLGARRGPTAMHSRPASPPPHANDDQGIGEIVSRLSENAKAYAKAEVDYAKTVASTRANAAKSGLIMVVVALLLAIAAFVALVVGLLISLETLVGPLAATGIVVVVTLALAGVLGMMGVKGIQRAIGGEK
jgi:hypothetical protein